MIRALFYKFCSIEYPYQQKTFKTIISRHNCFCELEFTAIYCQIKQRPIGRLIPEYEIMEEQVAGTK